jgi:CHASE2 domain-containing sensor protein
VTSTQDVEALHRAFVSFPDSELEGVVDNLEEQEAKSIVLLLLRHQDTEAAQLSLLDVFQAELGSACVRKVVCVFLHTPAPQLILSIRRPRCIEASKSA